MQKTSETNKYDLIVIGGGASGMMMAGRAAELGARVLLLERNKELGKKLKTTGGGRCNITNAEFDIRKFLHNFPESKEFLYSPFSKFSSEETFTFFEKSRLPLVVEARKRAFPKSQQAIDVCSTMEDYVRMNGVDVKTSARVASLNESGGKVVSVTTSKGDVIFADNFAIATGGLAAPETGSTGDGFSILKKLGHTIKTPNPNIVPLTSDAEWVHRLSGLTLSFMTIRFMQEGLNAAHSTARASKAKLKKTGKILFTHFGVSGPLILNSAHEVTKLLDNGLVDASIDLFPDTPENELDRRVWRLFEKNKNKLLRNILPEIVPEKLAMEILNFPDIQLHSHVVNSITKDERKRLVKKMKALTFPITGTLGFDKSVIADGGVALEEVNFKNMTSRLYPNIYLLGDTLNINRPSGGFSLQLCWTTGWVAGSDVGEKIGSKTAK